MDTRDELVFIYNADSGLVNLLKDAWHKFSDAATYPCRLCDLSWGWLGPYRAWRQYLGQLGLKSAFIYRDQYRQRYVQGNGECAEELPAIFIARNGTLHCICPAHVINQCKDLPALMACINQGIRHGIDGK